MWLSWTHIRIVVRIIIWILSTLVVLRLARVIAIVGIVLISSVRVCWVLRVVIIWIVIGLNHINLSPRWCHYYRRRYYNSLSHPSTAVYYNCNENNEEDDSDDDTYNGSSSQIRVVVVIARGAIGWTVAIIVTTVIFAWNRLTIWTHLNLCYKHICWKFKLNYTAIFNQLYFSNRVIL